MNPTGELPPNPFDVKGLGPAAEGALRPWGPGLGEHKDLYLAVDQTQQEYERFIGFAPTTATELDDAGRLVVVTGDRGYGKTSLIHRCVHHLKQSLTDASLKIVNVTRFPPFTAPSPDGQFVLDNYFDRLAHTVLTDLRRQDERYPDPGATPMPATSAYVNLSGKLRQHREVAAIILPAFQDQVTSPGQGDDYALARAHPVHHYMGFSVGRIMFFLESNNPEAVRSWHRHLDGDGRAEALVLNLGPLNPRDGWTFAGGRLGRAPGATWPTVDKQMMENLLEMYPGKTLSGLRELCHDVWRQAIADGDAEVTEKHIREYHERQQDFAPRRPYPSGESPGPAGSGIPPNEERAPVAPHRPGTDEDESGDQTDAQ